MTGDKMAFENLDPLCCKEAKTSKSDALFAIVLEGTDPSLVEYRQQRCEIVKECDFSQTGVCALKAAGMLARTPELEVYNNVGA